jgi:CheY-like chemotaxis protein
MSGRDVLVVEDDTDLRESLSQALRDHGFGVTPASNGQEALDLLRAGARPSVILLDLMMPVLNGWELRDALRHDPALARIPQLVISAYVDETEQVVLALPPGDCIRKPFHLRILIDAIERHCQPQTQPGAGKRESGDRVIEPSSD